MSAVDVLAVMDANADRMAKLGATGMAYAADLREARAAVAELIAADEEYDAADAAWSGEWYEVDSYGVDGSDFLRCLACDNESGAGLLNKGVTHEADCEVARIQQAEMRRATAIARCKGEQP
jgi:hypothetical protein